MYYYAYLDENNVVTGTYALPSVITVAGYVEITQEQHESGELVGKIYNAETGQFEDVPVWTGSTNDIQYKDTTSSLTDKLDDMDTEIAEKADTTDLHAHANKAVLDGITAEKVAAWDNGTGGNGAAGADGEDGVTFTPAVSAEGVISWTNDGGLENPAPVNIKGADGEDGANGTTVVVGTTTTAEAGTNASVTSTLNEETNTLTLNFTIPKGEAGTAGSADTAAQVLEKIKTVDGANSGLDADLLDGHNSDYFATATQLNGKADTDHTHSNYVTTTTYASGMSGKADTGHTHSNYASSSHTHSGYASSSHTHSDYLSTSGGTVSGNLNVTGIFRVNGQQSVYDSGTMITLSTNNRQTMIAGSAIYSKVAISVSSDERLKENIKPVDVENAVDFINNIDVKTFNYIGNDKECMGAIAQQVQTANPEIAEYFVSEDGDGYLAVKATDLVFPLIVAVQELTKRLSDLEAKN